MIDSINSLIEQTVGQSTKSFYDACKHLQQGAKKLMKLVKVDDIYDAIKIIDQLKQYSASLDQMLSSIKTGLEEFNFKNICESGYPSEFERACEEYGLNAVGRFPSYEFFPIKVEFKIEDLCVEINGKKYRSLNPFYLAETIKQERDEFLNAPFHLQDFYKALEQCYHLLKTKIIYEHKLQNKDEAINVSLKEIYNLLTSLPAMRKSYTINMFAFDISRLLDAQNKGIIFDQVIELGSARNIKNAIRIVSQDGHVNYYGSLRFIAKKGDEI